MSFCKILIGVMIFAILMSFMAMSLVIMLKVRGLFVCVRVRACVRASDCEHWCVPECVGGYVRASERAGPRGAVVQ